MAITTDIRFKRMQGEYQTLHDAQDELFDKVDTLESAVLGLTEMVSRNSEQIDALTEIVTENRDIILENQRQIADLHEKVDRLMTHLEVPPKPPAGFVKE